MQHAMLPHMQHAMLPHMQHAMLPHMQHAMLPHMQHAMLPHMSCGITALLHVTCKRPRCVGLGRARSLTSTTATNCRAKWQRPNLQGGLSALNAFVMGWLRLVGSLQLQVSFAKEPYKGDCILQKRPIIWARGGEAHRAEAAVRHQGKSK